MSGTSLDGLDLALCEIWRTDSTWDYKVLAAETIKYTPLWHDKLRDAHTLDALTFSLLDNEFGRFIGQQTRKFIERHKSNVDFISSHGHTVFHQPEKRLTVQIGNGASIAAESGITTINNFRVLDVALHGNGAPLVPIGDELLFSSYDYCLNLGGFANISFARMKKRIAYDICPVNLVLNVWAKKMGKNYDENGNLAHTGSLIPSLLNELNALPYYIQKPPKSLGREWVEQFVTPLLEPFAEFPQHVLRTLTEHITDQLAVSFICKSKKNVLVTGGGAHNKYLIELLQSKTNCKIIVPDKLTVDFKEAIIFAFLGVLRFRNEKNCLSSVTGARHDNIGGTTYTI